jgi:FkbM family methyltransferase
VTTGMPIHEIERADVVAIDTQIDLQSLHAIVPTMGIDPMLCARYYDFVRRIRETVHIPGSTDVRTVRLGAFDVDVDLGETLGCDLYYGLLRAEVGRELFLSLIGPDDLVVDLGAGFGLYTLACGAAVASSTYGKVLAFEPRPAQRKLLQRNLKQHGLDGRVESIDLDLESADGLPFQGASDSDTTFSSPTVIRSFPFDSVLRTRKLTRLDVIRVSAACDIPSVLADARRHLRLAADPLILLEIDETWLGAEGRSQLAESLRQLSKFGFSSFTVDGLGAVESPWEAMDGERSRGEIVLLVRRGSPREAAIRARMPGIGRQQNEVMNVRNLRAWLTETRSTSSSGQVAVALATALAVARLREVDTIADQLAARYGAFSTDHAGAIESVNAAHAEELEAHEETVLAFQAEIERLLGEGDLRLQDARNLRREVKTLHARYEVRAGQKFRDVVKAILGLGRTIKGRSAAPLS